MTSGPLMSLHGLFQVYHLLTPQHPRGTQGGAGGPDASLSRKSGLREVGIYAQGSIASQHSFHTTLPAPSAWRPTHPPMSCPSPPRRPGRTAGTSDRIPQGPHLPPLSAHSAAGRGPRVRADIGRGYNRTCAELDSFQPQEQHSRPASSLLSSLRLTHHWCSGHFKHTHSG